MRTAFDELYNENHRLSFNPSNEKLAYAILNKLAINSKNSTWGEKYPGPHNELFVDYRDDLFGDILNILKSIR